MRVTSLDKILIILALVTLVVIESRASVCELSFEPIRPQIEAPIYDQCTSGLCWFYMTKSYYEQKLDQSNFYKGKKIDGSFMFYSILRARIEAAIEAGSVSSISEDLRIEHVDRFVNQYGLILQREWTPQLNPFDDSDRSLIYQQARSLIEELSLSRGNSGVISGDERRRVAELIEELAGRIPIIGHSMREVNESNKPPLFELSDSLRKENIEVTHFATENFRPSLFRPNPGVPYRIEISGYQASRRDVLEKGNLLRDIEMWLKEEGALRIAFKMDPTEISSWVLRPKLEGEGFNHAGLVVGVIKNGNNEISAFIIQNSLGVTAGYKGFHLMAVERFNNSVYLLLPAMSQLESK